MKVDKQKVIDMLKEQGHDDQAAKAQLELPDQVDTEEHAETLSKLGVHPKDLAGGEDLDHPLGI